MKVLLVREPIFMNLRKLHRKLAPIVFIPLFLSALTGVAYRLGQKYFGLSSSMGDLMMSIHEGKFLGENLVPIYVLLLGMGLLAAIVSGLTLVRRTLKRFPSPLKQFTWRSIHGWLSLFIFLPLTLTAITGIAYRLGNSWFGFSQKQVAILMRLHEGAVLGSAFNSIYVLLTGAGLIAIVVTGIEMSGIFRKWWE
jgi:uncharacterized iron-regulated membrane protein